MGGVDGRSGISPPSSFVDLPCSMLVRDLAAVSGRRWKELDGALVFDGPKGSRAMIDGPEAGCIVETLRTAGPKIVQVFAAVLELWKLDTGGRDPNTSTRRSIADIATWMQGKKGDSSARDRDHVAATVAALTALRFIVGPSTRAARSDPPGAPIRLSDRLTVDHFAPVTFAPGAEWVRPLRGPGMQVAKLPRPVLKMHARNERYKILLSYYLSIMLRVNRKYGYHYRVNLRTLLEGAGILVPCRNVGRFIAAVYHAFDEMPAIRWTGPEYALYSSEEILDSKFSFSPSHELVIAYGDDGGAEVSSDRRILSENVGV